QPAGHAGAASHSLATEDAGLRDPLEEAADRQLVAWIEEVGLREIRRQAVVELVATEQGIAPLACADPLAAVDGERLTDTQPADRAAQRQAPRAALPAAVHPLRLSPQALDVAEADRRLHLAQRRLCNRDAYRRRRLILGRHLKR